MFLQSNFYPTLLYIFFFFFLAFLPTLFSLVCFSCLKKKQNKTPPFVSLLPFWGYPVCIGDTAYFCSGGGHTLVGTNHALEPIMRLLHVECMAKKFICGSFGYST